jgi:nucleoid-associated protein YgaU
MTSDAKIGLLLGLVFIFIIAFLINGLPNFHKDTNNNALTTNMVGPQNNPPGLAAKERKATEVIIKQITPAEKQPVDVKSFSTAEDNVRFITQLPKSTLPSETSKETVEIKADVPAQPLPQVEEPEVREVKSTETITPEVYVVAEGDSLVAIAKKIYGDDEGNKKININRIFEANREILKSPDEIYVGQKLIIPPLSALGQDKSKIESVFSSKMFKKVKSIGEQHLQTVSSKLKQGEQYVVQEGDSLWRIAAEQLGDGSRYTEIAKLNADILDDEDNLVVGTRLKMPGR